MSDVSPLGKIAWEMAEAEIPENWTERKMMPTFATFGGVALALAEVKLGPHVNQWVQSVSGVLAVSSGIAFDRHTTYRVLDSTNEARKAGIASPYVELNPIVGRVSSKKEITANKPKTLIDGAFVLSGALGWLVALPLVSGLIMVGINNNRKNRRINKAVETLNALNA